MPLTFCPHAFEMAVYLISRMLKAQFSIISSFKKLFGHPRLLLKLKKFGCFMLSLHTSLCVEQTWVQIHTMHFFELVYHSKCLQCYDPHSKKIFIPRHVIFLEIFFPFSSHISQDTITCWLFTASHFKTPPHYPTSSSINLSCAKTHSTRKLSRTHASSSIKPTHDFTFRTSTRWSFFRFNLHHCTDIGTCQE